MNESSRDYEQKEFDGLLLRSTMYPVAYTLHMETKIIGLLGGLLSRLTLSAAGEHPDPDGVGTAIEKFTERLEELGGPSFYMEVLKHTEVIEEDREGNLHKRPVKLDDFRGRLKALKIATGWVIQQNYTEYFSGASGKLEGLLEQIKGRALDAFQEQLSKKSNESEKTSPQTSTSKSGELSPPAMPA